MSDAPATARDQIRAAGLRATASRVLVLEALVGAARPLSHAELHALLELPGPLDRATLYRNLADLADAGLLRRLDLGDHVWRFEVTGSPGGAKADDLHPHFVCVDCGEVQCLDAAAVQIGPAARLPRAVERAAVSIQISGRCDNCD